MWLQVASGAAELYAEEVQQIRSLTPHGTQQLLADLEYFCNVLAALGVALPPTLTTWQVLPYTPEGATVCDLCVYASQQAPLYPDSALVAGWVPSLHNLHGGTLHNLYSGTLHNLYRDILPKQLSIYSSPIH